jgi:DNA-binding response OmpR family regulator
MERNILVVEDCEPVREVVEACLSYVGYNVTTAPDGRSTLRAITEALPDLVLLDLRLPDISGWDVLALMRHSPRYRNIPVVILTAMSDSASKAYGWQLGCTYYLTKPIDLNDLLLVVKQVLVTAALLPVAPALNESEAGAVPPASSEGPMLLDGPYSPSL